MKKNDLLKLAFLFVVLVSVSFTSCKKDTDEDTPPETTQTNNFKIGISDAKDPHSTTKSTDSIIDITKLTKCEVTISSIQLQNNMGDYVNVLTSEQTVDLRNFIGTVSELGFIHIPVGSYTSIKVAVSGVSTTYDGNTYTSSTAGSSSVHLNTGQDFDETQGVTNSFASGEIVFELPLVFTINNEEDIQDVRLFFDAETSTYTIPYTYSTYSWEFAGIREIPSVGVILEEGIQQIKHSPPMGITINAGLDVDYYGIHTFVDFHAKGGTINSHTSQHVYRGEDGSLTVDAETMATNTNTLIPTTIEATGETDVRSDETFKYNDIIANLAAAGYNLQSGHTYYFSLRKTWNITTDGQTYDLTRMCEPMPVTIP